MELIIVVILLSLHFIQGNILIEKNGEDSFQCLEGKCSCRTLEYIARASNISNILIRINSPYYMLDGVAQFTGVDNITITGQDQNTTIITCTTTNGGLAFVNSSNIRLQDFAIRQCGLSINSAWYKYADTSTALLVQDCSNFKIAKIKVSQSKGRGLSFINTIGKVTVISATFHNNLPRATANSGGGLQVVLRSFVRQLNVKYNVINCSFIGNKAMGNTSTSGGMRIIVFNNCSNSQFHISRCLFSENEASSGAGLLIWYGSGSSNNTATVFDNIFQSNKARKEGGGAEIGYSVHDTSPPIRNHFTFKSNYLINNSAQYGGSLNVFISGIGRQTNLSNLIEISNTTFSNNRANGGAAVNINYDTWSATGFNFLANITISNCQFIGSSTNLSNGAFYVNKIPVTFEGKNVFHNNSRTALFATSTQLTFNDNSQLYFNNNIGTNGGAVSLDCGAKLNVGKNVSFYFSNNSASRGGALNIFPDEVHSLHYSDSCFNPSYEKADFHFKENTATSGFGADIFSTTVWRCLDLCYKDRNMSSLSLSKLFNDSCIGRFHFQDENISKNHVATGPYSITVSNITEPIPLIPGREYKINIHIFDELGNNVRRIYPLNVRLKNPVTMAIPKVFQFIIYNRVVVQGRPHQSGHLVLEAAGVVKTLRIHLQECPPGFKLTVSSSTPGLCECIKSSNATIRDFYCSKSRAKLSPGFWIGVINNAKDDLYLATCAAEFRNSSNDKHLWKMTLPQNFTLLEKAVCGDRIGLVCGRCRDGLAVYYLSDDFSCETNASCSYGIVLYIVCELLPVTILFLVILLFNISLTSGTLYSFLFYAQAITVSSVTAFGSIKPPKTLNTLLQILRIFYGIFNMDLTAKHIDFCLIDTTSAMPLFLFKYLTILYALLLIIGTILIFRIHSCYSCVKLCRRCGRRNIRGSIVDGLSAFILICYVNCAKTTSNILSSSSIYSIHNGSIVKTVPLFDGGMDYLHGEHLCYAVPAFLCIIFILIPPPLFLLMEPLLTKLFGIECFNKTFVSRMYSKLRLKIMPFLDSFQACFKDKYRYYAGLYFIYRLIGPMSGVINSDIPVLYSIQIGLFSLILFTHIVQRPYKTTWHSLVELSILFNLILVFTVTLLNYADNFFERKASHSKEAFSVLVCLLSLPMIYFVSLTAVTVYKMAPKKTCCNHWKSIKILNWLSRTKDVSNGDPEIPARLLDSYDPMNYESI